MGEETASGGFFVVGNRQAVLFSTDRVICTILKLKSINGGVKHTWLVFQELTYQEKNV